MAYSNFNEGIGAADMIFQGRRTESASLRQEVPLVSHNHRPRLHRLFPPACVREKNSYDVDAGPELSQRVLDAVTPSCERTLLRETPVFRPNCTSAILTLPLPAVAE